MKVVLTDVTVEVLRDEWSLIINAEYRHATVGHAWCGIKENRLCIGDLKVEDQAQIPWSVGNNVLVFFGVMPKKWNFRNCGIGKLLMERLFLEAHAAGIREIWGSVTQKDIDRTPHLLEWYQRLGFTVGDADAECIHNAVRKIVMQLDVGG